MQKLMYTMDATERLFLCEDPDSDYVVYPSDEAQRIAREALGVDEHALLLWDIPHAFHVRYGSSYVGRVQAEGKHAQFHTSDAGDFREEDLKWQAP